MQPRSLCRFRRTCKTIDCFVEKNRHNLSVRADNAEWVLYIRVDYTDKPKVKYGVRSEIVFDDLFLLPERNIKNYYRIKDPYQQLAALKFGIIYVEFTVDYNLLRIQGSAYETRQRQRKVFRKRILPILTEMGLTTDWLGANSMNLNGFNDLIDAVSFSRLYVKGTRTNDEVFQSGKTKHCNELNLEFAHSPTSLCHVLGDAKTVWIDFTPNICVTDVLSNFLEKIRLVGNTCKNLQNLVLNGSILNGKQSNVNQIPGVSELWTGKPNIGENPFVEEISFYKLLIDKRMAILVENGHRLYLHIEEDCSREVMLNVFSIHLFYNIPYDCSAFMEKFQEFENDRDAVTFVNNTYDS